MDGLLAKRGQRLPRVGKALLRPPVAMPPVIVQQPFAQGLNGRRLQGRLQGGEHLVAAGVEVGELADQALPHPFGGKGRRQIQASAMHSGADGRLNRGAILRFVYGTLLAHAGKHQVAPAQRPLRPVDGVAGAGCLGNAGQHGQLRQAQRHQGLAVVGAGGSLGAVGPLAEWHHVDVKLQNLVLGQLLLDLQRQQHLLEFAQKAPLQAEGDIARQLHGDGAGAGA